MKTHTENRVHTTILRGLALLTLGLAVSSEAEAKCAMSTKAGMAVITATKEHEEASETCRIRYTCRPETREGLEHWTLSGKAVRVNGTGGSGKNIYTIFDGIPEGTGCSLSRGNLTCNMREQLTSIRRPMCEATIQGNVESPLLATTTVTCECVRN